MNSRVAHLFRKIESRHEMEPQSTIEIVAGSGIRGDASFGRKKRQILIVSGEVLSELNLNPGDIRENIVIEGMDVNSLSPDDVLNIGTASMRIVGPCDPCSRMDELRDGLQHMLEGRRGVLARAISDGQISIGDEILISVPD